MAAGQKKLDLVPLARRESALEATPTGEAFEPEWIDFQHGIRVGNLEPYQRITRILKYNLELQYRTPFVTEKWGRGAYWQWICWLPRANRETKPMSHNNNFGCAKLFISVERKPPVFKAGLQIERGYLEAPRGETGGAWVLNRDWDWHRLMQQCSAGSELDHELRRLIVREGFVAEVGDWETNTVLTAKNFRSARQIRDAAVGARKDEWAGFQLYYPMTKREVRSCTGYELVRAILGIFRDVVPAMNACMQIRLQCEKQPGWRSGR